MTKFDLQVPDIKVTRYLKIAKVNNIITVSAVDSKLNEIEYEIY